MRTHKKVCQYNLEGQGELILGTRALYLYFVQRSEKLAR